MILTERAVVHAARIPDVIVGLYAVETAGSPAAAAESGGWPAHHVPLAQQPNR
jgi:hypothetical protein